MSAQPLQSFQELMQYAKELAADLFRCDFGIQFLDDALLGLRAGETTLIGARSGSGKTELATRILQTQEEAKARPVLYFALDHEKGEIENRILWKKLSQEIKRTVGHPLHGKYLRYTEWLNGAYTESLGDMQRNLRLRYSYLNSTSESQIVYSKNNYTAQGICKIIEETARYYGLIIIDHFHALVFNGDRMQAQRDAMKLICECAEKTNKPILIMGQFRKRAATNKCPIPDFEEFSGPADLYYLPQNIIVLAANTEESAAMGETFFHITKSRLASDAKPFVGVHHFDTETKGYSKDYSVRRFVSHGMPIKIDRPLDLPKWAHGATKPKIYQTEKPVGIYTE